MNQLNGSHSSESLDLQKSFRLLELMQLSKSKFIYIATQLAIKDQRTLWYINIDPGSHRAWVWLVSFHQKNKLVIKKNHMVQLLIYQRVKHGENMVVPGRK